MESPGLLNDLSNVLLNGNREVAAALGWLGSDCEERAGSPQIVCHWGLAALDRQPPIMKIEHGLADMELRGRKVTIMGLGHFGGGVEAARWLARRGARVTVTDLADRTTLAESLAALDGEPIAEFHLGGHREEDFRHADLIVVNPAVRPGNPFLEMAAERHIPRTTEVGLFLHACPAPVVGVTGSNGKSTTAAMIAAILEADGRRTWLGGNIGRSLLPHLDQIGPDDGVVLELSSFQLQYLADETPMPHVAVVTNYSPNHLDWHSTPDEYMAAKQRLLTGQTAQDVAVLNMLDPQVATWKPFVRGKLVSQASPETDLPPLAVPGLHNRINAACAASAALAAGCFRSAVREGLQSFRGLPQRIEPCGEAAGRHFYNDSTATTPESTVAALESVDRPIWLLAGGRDKGCRFDALVSTIIRRTQGVALFGQVAQALQSQLAAQTPDFDYIVVETMEAALDWCWNRSGPGDAVVFSPACASSKPFPNFRVRGRHFANLVEQLHNTP